MITANDVSLPRIIPTPNEPLPQEEDGFSTPGYIIHQFHALDGKRLFIRNLLIPELFFVLLEKRAIKDEGYDGKRKLYQVGKQFGYRLATLNRLPRGNAGKVTISIVYKFFETAYAKKMTLTFIDNEKRISETEFDNFVVASAGGLGYTPFGAGAGVWSYLFGDYKIEGGFRKLSEDKHLLVCADKKTLKERGFELIECNEMPDAIEPNDYLKYNVPQASTSKSLSSFNELLGKGIISYAPGVMKMKASEERILPLEISMFFSLEKIFNEKIVLESAYTPFYNIGISLKGDGKSSVHLIQLFSAFGFGIVQVTESNNSMSIFFHGYPWLSKNSEKTNFSILKGSVLGFLNGNTGKKYQITSLSSAVKDDVFDVSMELEITD